MKKLILLIAVGFIPFAIFYYVMKGDAVVPHRALVEQALMDDIHSRLCIQAVTFPYATGGSNPLSCEKCKELYEAGLLTRSEGRTEDSVSYVYDLAEEGKPFYTGSLGPNHHAGEFCFAKAHVHQFIKASAPFDFGGNQTTVVTYVMEAVEASPILFNEVGQSLGLKPPKPGKPSLYDQETTNVVFAQDMNSAWTYR